MTPSTDSVMDAVADRAIDGIEHMVSSDAVKMEDINAGTGVLTGLGAEASVSSGDPVMGGVLAGFTLFNAGIALGPGDYPGRAAAPLYRVRDAARGAVYDRSHADEVREELSLEDLEEAYPDADVGGRLVEHYGTDSLEEAFDAFQDRAVSVGREQYISEPAGPGALVDEVAETGLEGILPGFRFSEDVEELYTAEDMDPYDIKEELIEGLGDLLLDEMDGDRADRVETGLEVVSDGAVEDAYLDELEVGEDPDRAELYDAVVEDMTFQGQCIAQNKDEAFQRELEGRSNAVQRFDPAAVDHVFEDHDYAVFSVEDPEVIATINEDLGTCKRRADSYMSEFEDWAGDEDTKILGVRRDGEEWAGFTRSYSFETSEGSVLAVDTWEMPYEEGSEGGTPKGSCDFEEYGAVLHVEALANIRLGLDEEYDHVVAGTSDGRVKYARECNRNRDTRMQLPGMGTKSTTYGLHISTNPDGQRVHVLMEDEFESYDS